MEDCDIDIDNISTLEDSKCYDCKYRIRRVLDPRKIEAELLFSEYYVPDHLDDKSLFIQEICRLLGYDLDGSVIECGGYSQNIDNEFSGVTKFLK